MKKKPTPQLVFDAVGTFLLIMTPIASSRPTSRDVNMPILKIKNVSCRCMSIIVKRTTKGKTKVKNASSYSNINNKGYRLLSKIDSNASYFFSD